MTSPSPNGVNGASGRDGQGRFAKGNAGGPGNPQAKRAGQLRSAMYRSVKTTDMRQIMQQLVEQAKGGDVAACREVLNRCLGKPVEVDLLERIEELEQRLGQWDERS